jgi:hypothetical protein
MTAAVFYSASKQGFYTPALHRRMPADAVPISSGMHRLLLEGQARGMRIVPDEAGRPMLMPAPAPPPRRVMPGAALLRRLPLTCRQAITAAAVQAAAAGDGELLTWLMDLAACAGADLDDPALRAALDRLASAGLITPAERAALLADATPNDT